jgi:hypothetical protein
MRNFAFHFDDGRRLRIDTIEGKLTRLTVTLEDTTVAITLPRAALAHVYEAMVAARFWELGPNHPEYPPLPSRAASGGHVDVELFARADTLVRALKWRAARLPARPGDAGGDWARIAAVIDAIERAVHESPEYRALPRLAGE